MYVCVVLHMQAHVRMLKRPEVRGEKGHQAVCCDGPAQCWKPTMLWIEESRAVRVGVRGSLKPWVCA